MLVIRKEQMAAFRQAQVRRHDRELEEVLREKVPECRQKTSQVLRDLVSAGRKRAEHFQIFHPDDVKRFIIYVGRYGLEFGDTPESSWATPILSQLSTSGCERMDQIDEIRKMEGGK